MSALCLCGRQRPFARCCEPYLTGSALAPTAEALMRSRYSAFCRGNLDYLLATHHPDQKKADDHASLRQSVESTQWLNLIILKTQKGRPKDRTGVVEFACAYRPKALLSARAAASVTPIQQLHERSRFVKEGAQWLYTAGDILPAYQPGRTQLCWCGSGKKFKRCHARS